VLEGKSVRVVIKDLIEAEYNPREITENQFNDLKLSIEKFGFVEPIIVNNHPDRVNVVIGGHQRLKVAEFLGMESVPAVLVELDEDEERELNIRLNANGGSWNWDKIANEWDYDSLKNWGLNIPNPSFDMPELLDDATESAKDSDVVKGDRTEFILDLSYEHKAELIKVINNIKIEHNLTDTEDALILLVRSYE
tara:strand:- start:138 stop:719 length:582 start_codon:yes stop_codon:yes gene_type:complete